MESLAHEISYRQLLQWALYFKHKDSRREKLDHYMANLTSWVATKVSGKSQKSDKFYISYEPKGFDLAQMPVEEVKKMWFGFLGLKEEDA